jgi:ABC-type transport system involved in multi-copper enzyme maturation permease subunit
MLIRFYAIAVNTFLETIRQPVYGIIILLAGLFMMMNVGMAAYTLENDNRLLLEASLSTLMLAGLFLAVFSASAVFNREIENKTTLASLSKPVARPVFVLGKAAGIFSALTVAFYIMFLFFVFTQRHSVLQNSSDPWDQPAIFLGGGSTLFVLVLAAFLNYMYDYEFSGTALALALPLITAAMFLTGAFGKTFESQPYWKDMPGGQVILAAFLVFLSILVLAAFALAASTRLGQGGTLLVCGIVLILGVIADFVLGQFGDKSVVADVAYRAIPNIGVFLLVEPLVYKGVTIPFEYVSRVALYALLMISAMILLAIAMFQRREVG